jgi:dipeptidyl aminopeptidase/acylaminoacyl peptidase
MHNDATMNGLNGSMLVLAVIFTVTFGCTREPQPATRNVPETNSALAGAKPALITSFPKPTRLIENGWKASWAPDGQRIVFGKPMGDGLAVFDLRTMAATPLTEKGKDPEWSGDGRYIAFVREPSFDQYQAEQVWLLDLETKKERNLGQGGYPSWATDSKTLFYISRTDNKVMSVRVGGPEDSQPSVYSEPSYSWYASISPDGQSIAYGSQDQLKIIDQKTGRPEVIWSTPGNRGLLPSWSPDGKFVAFGGFNDSTLGVWVLDVDAGKAVQVIAGHFTMPAWSKDGKRLAFDFREGDKREIWAVDVSVVEGGFKAETR